MSSSLVAYDDSDSEAEVEKTEVPNTSSRGKSLSSSSVNPVQYFAPGILDTKSMYEMQPTDNTDSSGMGTVCEDHPERYTQNNNTDLASPYCRRAHPSCTAFCMSYRNHEQTSSSSINSGISPQKRMHKDSITTVKGIRPYIPKRLRQENSGMYKEKESDQGENSNCSVKLGITGEQTLTKISELIKPYLGSKYKLTEVPKNLVFHISEHSGPVNEIQWCPVREQSHMLLSASMDKTIKWQRTSPSVLVMVCCLPRHVKEASLSYC
uniref:Uncharacterized protein n=1 Tax=Apteryx owenii TaxID=8824 RepID=A0A8B9Q3Y7_APTOW